jgi:cation transport regulator ChaC
VRLKKVLTAYAASGVLGMKAAHPEGSPVLLRGRLLWRPGARARRRDAVWLPQSRALCVHVHDNRDSLHHLARHVL